MIVFALSDSDVELVHCQPGVEMSPLGRREVRATSEEARSAREPQHNVNRLPAI